MVWHNGIVMKMSITHVTRYAYVFTESSNKFNTDLVFRGYLLKTCSRTIDQH